MSEAGTQTRQQAPMAMHAVCFLAFMATGDGDPTVTFTSRAMRQKHERGKGELVEVCANGRTWRAEAPANATGAQRPELLREVAMRIAVDALLTWGQKTNARGVLLDLAEKLLRSLSDSELGDVMSRLAHQKEEGDRGR